MDAVEPYQVHNIQLSYTIFSYKQKEIEFGRNSSRNENQGLI